MTFGFTESRLRDALRSLSDDESCCRHIFGRDDPDHELSALQRITAVRILDYEAIAADPSSPTEADLIARAETFRSEHGPPLNLRDVIQGKSPSMSLAAEFKRASPSKGDIAPDLNAAEQGAKYAESGASIVSVLTEGRWFKGSMDDLTEVRLATTDKGYDRPAVLRKDFVVNRYQIAEAAARGGDTVLLIVAVTPSDLLKDLIDYCRSLDMEPLVEVHADDELDVALNAGARVIGVNNRNLHTFKMDLGTTDRTASVLKGRGLEFDHNVITSRDASGEPRPDYCLCALSGMSSSADVDRYRQAGVGMCLIGESLMRAPDPKAAIEGLCLDPNEYAKQAGGAGGAYTGGLKIMKVCGVTDPDDALAACRAGANLIGVIFAEKSKRKVTKERARAVVDAVRAFGERSSRISIPTPSSNLDGSPVAALGSKARTLENSARRGCPLVVGVFQNQDEAYVRECVEESGLDLVQLHGKEGMEAASAERCGVPAIRVVDIETDADGTGTTDAEAAVTKLLDSVTSDPVAILLDTAIKGSKEGGGTGVAFDWSLAEKVQSRGLPVLVAGGLTPDNVGQCVGGTRPWGVDVSSGVEAGPGKKDLDKVAAFVKGARDAEEEAAKGF